MVLGMSRSSLANLLWSLGGSPRQDLWDGFVPDAKLSRLSMPCSGRVYTWSPMGVGPLVTWPHFMGSSGPHQAPQSIPQPTQPAKLAMLGMERSSSSMCSLWEGKDMSWIILRAARSGQSLDSKDGEWWQERLSSALGDALR